MGHSAERFYQMELRHRPALYGDIGSMLRINGLVVGGNLHSAILMLPDIECSNPKSYQLTVDEWSEFIKRSDDPEILVGPSKVFQRKLRYAISGAVQQRVWAADGFKCYLCHKAMGETLLTIDHFVPLEQGGLNDTSNYLTLCRKCNKDKGSGDAQEWCNSVGLEYAEVVAYLAMRVL